MKTSDYIKQFENVTRIKVDSNKPVIVRLDGRAFSTQARKYYSDSPFSVRFKRNMIRTAQAICNDMQGCKLAFVQSDEMSFFLRGYDSPTTEIAFGGNINKINSIYAGIAAVSFNKSLKSGSDPALFDSRTFELSKIEDVLTYFKYRQNDGIRNCINTLGRLYLSHNQMQNKSTEVIKQLLTDMNVDVDSYVKQFGMGTFLTKEKKYKHKKAEVVVTNDILIGEIENV